jgi:hypothetical protein
LLAKQALNNIKNPKKGKEGRRQGQRQGQKEVVCSQSNKAQLCDILLNFIALEVASAAPTTLFSPPFSRSHIALVLLTP